MPFDTLSSADPERSKINLAIKDEVRCWTRQLGVTRETLAEVMRTGKSWRSINQLLSWSSQSLEISNHVLTIFGVRNGDEHPRAVNVACRVLEPRIEGLLIPCDVCRLEGG
jgi:hypothetical protein